MSTIDAANVAQLAQRLSIVTEEQINDAWYEIGTRTGPAEPLLKILERKGSITPWQASKLIKGDTDGYILGGYRLLYRIAAGSFGRVYRADNPRTGEIVAMKVLRRRWADDKRKVELFEREGKIGLAMRHPNIVQILAVSRDPATGQYYIVMEFVEGGNLRDFLAIRKKLGPDEGLRLLEETASGLASALERGLTHRDLKPTNILISSNRTAKLVDFGLAELAGDHKEKSEDAAGGEVDRTVDYAGLEKATGVKKGDARSDIYFLGCVFHEMITGRPLLAPTRDPRAAMIKARFEISGLMKRDDPDLPPPLYSLLSRMVSFDPTLRFQKYDDLIAEIRSVHAEVRGEKPDVPAATGPKTIYVIEHNTKLQDAFRDKLKQKGYRVLISMNPSQAVARYQSQPFDGLIVDVGTAGREGIEAFEKVIRESGAKRITCGGLLILNEDQAHWANEIEKFPRTAHLVRPVTMRQIIENLMDFVPTVKPAE
jgi:eukaryotic-like serine/threonine-protein kinase